MFGAYFHLVFDFANFAHRICTSPVVLHGQAGSHIVLAAKSLASWKKRVGGALVFALEGENQVERTFLHPAYKANRSSGGETSTQVVRELRAQILEFSRTMKASFIQSYGFEADDAIAAFVRNTKDRVAVVSSDRDLWSLTQFPHVSVYTDNPASSSDPMVTPERIAKSLLKSTTKFIDPSNIPMLKAVLGDDSDNIPRVPYLKTASILGAFDGRTNVTPDEFFAWVDTQQDKKMTSKVNEHRDQIRTMYEVVRLRDQSPLQTTISEGNPAAYTAYVKRYGALGALDYVKELAG